MIYSLDSLYDRMGDNDVIYVTPDEMKALLISMPEPMNFKPNPPKKLESKTNRNGFFSSESSFLVEYDHHAPEYLRELEAWRVRQRDIDERRRSGIIEIVGPHKTYRIELAK